MPPEIVREMCEKSQYTKRMNGKNVMNM